MILEIVYQYGPVPDLSESFRCDYLKRKPHMTPSKTFVDFVVDII